MPSWRSIARCGLGVALVLGLARIGAETRGQTATRPAPEPLAPVETSPAAAPKPETWHDDFESSRPIWVRERSEATVELLKHDRSTRAAHDGATSEHFHFVAGRGTGLFYSYALPKAPVNEALKASLYIRSDHGGTQLLGRVVLPADIDPDTRQPSYVIVTGSVYDASGRWQRLDLGNIAEAVERQARVLRAATRRPIPLEGAYLERLVVNLYGGVGETETFLDDLTVAPVPERPSSPPVPAPSTPQPSLVGPVTAPETNPTKVPWRRVGLERNRLTKDNAGWLFSAIEAPGADLELLQASGFDLLSLPTDAPEQVVREAARRGMLLMPRLDPTLADPISRATSFPAKDNAIFWNLGDDLGGASDPARRVAERETVRAAIRGLKDLKGAVSPWSTANVVGSFPDYARAPTNLSLIGATPLGWGTAQQPNETSAFWNQRRNLTALENPHALYWTWLPASAPPWAREAIWGTDTPPAWGTPLVQPEQMRLYTYAALASGLRGIGFRADASLTGESGRINLIEATFLNTEIKLLEPILAAGGDPYLQLKAFPPDPVPRLVFNPNGSSIRTGNQKKPEVAPHPSIRATGVQTSDRRGWLLLMADYVDGAQWVPPQMAASDLRLTIPGAPDAAQAFEISLGDVKLVDRERIPGGVRLSLVEFGVTSAILVTSDLALIERLRAEVARIRPRAIQMAIEQAQLQLTSTHATYQQLAALGRTVEDAGPLFTKAQESLRSAQEALAREDYSVAWAEARRVARPLRILMRVQWDKAAKDLADATKESIDQDGYDYVISGVSAGPLLTYNTLPQLYMWIDKIRTGRWGKTLISGGSFDDPAGLAASGWTNANDGNPELNAGVVVTQEGKAPAGPYLRLTVAPKRPADIDRIAPFVDRPVAAVRTPSVSVGAGQLVRIRVKVFMPRPMVPGGGGLIIRDSIGGEPLQYRTTKALPYWQEVVLYRRPAVDSELSVLLGLAGIGEAHVDELKVERIEHVASRGDAVVSRPPTTPRVATPRPTTATPSATRR